MHVRFIGDGGSRPLTGGTTQRVPFLACGQPEGVADEVCTVASGHTVPTTSDNPFNPSQTTEKVSVFGAARLATCPSRKSPLVADRGHPGGSLGRQSWKRMPPNMPGTGP
jgi:hypothetical protein